MSIVHSILGKMTTADLLNELIIRNSLSEAHRNSKDQTAEHLRKVHLAFSLRPGGLEATRVEYETNQ